MTISHARVYSASRALAAAGESPHLDTRPRCPHCLDEGHVCEDHPEVPWEGIWGTVEGHAEHGGIGMPCTYCCSPVPEDGIARISAGFTPDWKRP